jgi:hypothetical protein
MNHLVYVYAGYALTAAAIVVYAWRVIARGRRLSPLVAEERRRWM